MDTKSKLNFAKYIDHTNLKPDAIENDIIKLCEEAKQYDFKSVCVNPCYVKLAKKQLENSDVLVCTVIGFPLGATTTETKIFEAREAVANGANEVDMVMNIGAAKSGNWDLLRRDIAGVVNAVKDHAKVKVILETCLLTNNEIIKACKCAVEAQADFVKTSTGFSTSGATSKDVALMKETVGDACEVKASGGIRNLEMAEIMISSGATRIGTSSGARILRAYENGI